MKYMKSKLEDMTKILVRTALGKDKADLVIKDGNLVNVHTGEILWNVDVAVKKDRIAFVGNADHTIGSKTRVVKATGQYLAPGFLDAHVHIDDSMLTVTEFARLTVPRGTTGVFLDPHEIANVIGLEGARLMLDESKGCPMKVFLALPSCIPSAPGFETAGAEIDAEELKKALKWDETVALAEMMDIHGVLSCNDKIHSEIQATLRAGKVVEGHTMGLMGMNFTAYVAAGMTSSHEILSREICLERARMGNYTFISPLGEFTKTAFEAITLDRIETRHLSLITDDRNAISLCESGHMDYNVKCAVQSGVDPITAIQMATLNTAEHYNVDVDVGSISPSKCADIVILSDLEKVKVDKVIAYGELVADNGKLLVDLKAPEYPKWSKNTMHLKKKLEPEDFVIKAKVKEGSVKVNVIQFFNFANNLSVRELSVKNWAVLPMVERGILKVAIVERHKYSGNIGKAFGELPGLITSGAVASSVSHDSHNITVVGTNDTDMATAVNVLADVGGGSVAVKNGKVRGLIELPIAGIMSNERAEVVIKKGKHLEQAWMELGHKPLSSAIFPEAFLNIIFLAIPFGQEVFVTDKGLVDARKMPYRFIDVFA